MSESLGFFLAYTLNDVMKDDDICISERSIHGRLDGLVMSSLTFCPALFARGSWGMNTPIIARRAVPLNGICVCI